MDENDGFKDKTLHVNWRIPKWFPELSQEKRDLLQKFLYELIHFNGRMNLISARTEKEADRIHFADCILGGQLIFKDNPIKEVYDIGSGNGLPGIIFAILYPERNFILVEKDARKAEFLKHCSSRLSLKNVAVRQCRLEDIPESSIESAVSRAFASLSKALISSRRQCKKGCLYYHFKGENWPTEVAQMPTQLCSFWEPSLLGSYTLPETSTELSIVVAKRI